MPYYRSLSESEVGRGCAALMFEWNCSLHVGEAPVGLWPNEPSVYRCRDGAGELTVAGGTGICSNDNDAVQPDAAKPEKPDGRSYLIPRGPTPPHQE